MKLKIKQSGFSLVEAMVGLAIAGGISLVLMNQQETSSKMQSKAMANQDINTAAAAIQSSLSNRAICSTSLANKAFGETIDHIFEAQINPLFPGNSPAEFVRSTPPVHISSVGVMLSGKIMITEMKLFRDPVTNKEYLNVNFDLDPENRKKMSGGKSITRKFEIQTLKTGAGRIISCHSEQTNLLQSAIQRSCLTMGASWVNGVCKLTNLPQCVIVDETCKLTGTYRVTQETYVSVQYRFTTRTCTMRYDRDGFPCVGTSTFRRRCTCNTVGCTCNTGFTSSMCYSRHSEGCVDDPYTITYATVSKCCQP
jgi:type II secretory pathway pseudopilin PulG